MMMRESEDEPRVPVVRWFLTVRVLTVENGELHTLVYPYLAASPPGRRSRRSPGAINIDSVVFCFWKVSIATNPKTNEQRANTHGSILMMHTVRTTP